MINRDHGRTNGDLNSHFLSLLDSATYGELYCPRNLAHIRTATEACENLLDYATQAMVASMPVSRTWSHKPSVLTPHVEPDLQADPQED